MSTGSTASKIHKQTSNHCTRCGRGEHSREKCPAVNATCHKCKRRGHCRSQCFAKSSMSLVTAGKNPHTEVTLDGTCIDAIISGHQTAWIVKIRVRSQDTTFIIDTRAEVTAVLEEFFLKLRDKDIQIHSRLR